MIGKYMGNYTYDKQFINLNAPENIGVYYMGTLNNNGSLGTLYVGRAKGNAVSIKSRLLDHINNNEWPDITHFGYVVCTSEAEVEDLEKKRSSDVEILNTIKESGKKYETV